MPVFLTPQTTFGWANTFLFSVSLPLFPFIPSLSDIQDWSNFAQSASAVVHADRGYGRQRRVPQMLARGPFNSWGYDKGISAEMTQTGDGQWELEIMSTWPSFVQLNVFGYDDFYYGDVDGDGVLDRLPPNTAAPVYCNLSAPPRPHISWTLVVNDANLT